MSRVVGIDLGTTNSVVSVLEGGEAVVIASAEGGRTTPSVVAFSKAGELLVGELAKRQAVTNVTRTVRSVKRHMGTPWRFPETGELDGQTYTPQQLSAFILQKLRRDAERYLGDEVTDAVITVPAYFDDAQRQATKDAGEIAGLNVLRIINEPTAAALAYGLEQPDREETILVFDLGGGTFDVSLLELGGGVVEVKSTAGDTHLGGDDWDQALVEFLADAFEAEHHVSLREDPVAMQRLREAAERAKIELSGQAVTTVNLPYLGAGPDGPLHLEEVVTRSEFQRLTEPLLERCKGPFEQALQDAKLNVRQLDHVILVGGSTRMPAVSDLVRQLTGNQEPHRGVNPDEVVAIGAALQGGVLKGEVKDILLLDVTPLSLGIETKGGVMTVLIGRNTTIPARASEFFTTSETNQSTVEIQVYQGERDLAKHNRKLGVFELKNIPPAPRGVPQIEVSFNLDASGIMHVAAKELATGISQELTITGSSTLSKDELARMMEEARTFASEDQEKREEVELFNSAELIIHQAEELLRAHEDADPALQRRVQLSVADLLGAMESGEVLATREALTELSRHTDALGAAIYEAATRPAPAAEPSMALSEEFGQEFGEELEDEPGFGDPSLSAFTPTATLPERPEVLRAAAQAPEPAIFEEGFGDPALIAADSDSEAFGEPGGFGDPELAASLPSSALPGDADEQADADALSSLSQALGRPDHEASPAYSAVLAALREFHPSSSSHENPHDPA